ncbi:unnamed protein product [Ectocarpus sp. 12 AP-2014]
MSDLKMAAASSVKSRVPRVFRRNRRRQGRRRRQREGPHDDGSKKKTSSTAPPIRGEQRLQQQQQHRHRQQQSGDAAVSPSEDGEAEAATTATEREARAVSRRLLKRRALRGARWRPILVVRVIAAVLAAAGRGIGMAILGAFRRLHSRRHGEETSRA